MIGKPSLFRVLNTHYEEKLKHARASDYFETGQYVYVMVDPDTEEIIKVYSDPSKPSAPYDINLSNWHTEPQTEVRQGGSTSTNITFTLLYTEEEETLSFSLVKLVEVSQL